MLWIDNFLFNGEEVAFYRLEYLFPLVDKFYICEKSITYQGEEKKTLYIDLLRKRFEPYLSKIEFAVDSSKTSPTITGNETAHRNYCASKILSDYPDSQFLLTVCDADEIPNLETMRIVKEGLYNNCCEGCIYMEMPIYYYNLNWSVETEMKFNMPFVVNDVLLKSYSNLQAFREQRGPVFGTFDCGWHFSYFMSVPNIIRKIESFSQLEYNRSEFKESEVIMDCIVNGKDLFKRDYIEIIKNTITKSKYPKEILDLNKATMKAQFGV